MYFWIRKNALSGRAIEDGKVWTFCSAKVLAEWFPYLNPDKIYRIIGNLVKNGLLEKGNFNNNKFDRTAWYCITDKAYGEFAKCDYDNSFLQNGVLEVRKTELPFCKNAKCINKDNKEDIKEDNKKDNNISYVDGNLYDETAFDNWWNLYDKKVGKESCRKVWGRMKDNEKVECLKNTPAYVQATPDKTFRKDPLTYLHRRGWEDEIITKSMFNQPTKSQIQNYERQEREREIADRMARMLAADEQERANDGVYATETIGDM